MTNQSQHADQAAQIVVKAFCDSLEDAFSQMVFLPTQLGEPAVKRDGFPTGCLSGTIGLSGIHEATGIELRTTLSLIFPKDLALRIFRSMMMEADAPVEIAELRDVVGELTNMTAGGGKSRLAEQGYRLSLSLPTVVVGQDHYLGDSSDGVITQIVPVTIDEGLCYMEISLV